MRSREVFWLIGTFCFAALITGLLFSFNYFESVDAQFHDTYIVIYPIYFGLILWVIFTYLIFLMKEAYAEFSNVGGLWILLISNSLVMAIVFYVGYVIYGVFVLNFVVESFKQSGATDLALKSFYNSIMVCGFFFLGFTFIEYLLIRRLMKLVRRR